MKKFNQFISVADDRRIFVNGRPHPDQSDDHKEYNPETGEDVSWFDIRKAVGYEFHTDEIPEVTDYKEPISKADALKKLLDSGLLKFAGNTKKPITETVVTTLDTKPNPDREKMDTNNKVLDTKTSKLDTKPRTGNKNPKSIGTYEVNLVPYTSARRAAIAAGANSPTTLIKWAKKEINGCKFIPK